MTYVTTGGIPQPGYEFYGFMQPAGVYPSEFVLIESIWATLRLVAAGGGLTIQPRIALEPAFDGTAVVPLEGVDPRRGGRPSRVPTAVRRRRLSYGRWREQSLTEIPANAR